jgi:hypothetical protein
LEEVFESYSDIIAHALKNCVDPTVVDSFQSFLRRMGDEAWLIVSDYHVERNKDGYENDVLVFTVLPAAKNYLNIEKATEGLPRKLSSTKTLSEDNIKFLNELNHFTFIFISDKKFRPTVKNADDARASLDLSIKRLLNGKNGSHCPPDVIDEFKRLRKDADANGFNLKLFNQATLAAAFASAIGLQIIQTVKVDILYWLSDRDAMIDNLNGIVYTLFHLHMVELQQKYKLRAFNLSWFGENAEKAISGKMKPLALAPLIRIPDFFAAPIAASNFSATENSTHIPNEKYTLMLREVIADNPNVAVLRLKNDPGWAFSRIDITRTVPDTVESD